MDPSKSINTRPSIFADYYKLLQPYMYIALSAALFLLMSGLSGGNGTGGSFSVLLLAFVISYSVVYHGELFFYFFLALSVFTFITHFLPIEYSSFLSYTTMYVWLSILFLPALYDFYIYYNKKQAPPSIPAQKGGSSRKRHK